MPLSPARLITAAREQDMGIIIKNPIANAIYEKPRPEGDGADLWDRAQRILSDEVTGNESRVDTALRWLLSDEKVHTAIVGTTNINHLEQNVAAAERGPLDDSVLERARQLFDEQIAEEESG